MTGLTIERQPELHNPIAVVAFAGWNDAASAATDATKYLVRRLGARRFASIDAEEYYDFRENRPHVRLGYGGARNIEWPKNEFFFARNPVGAHDFVIFTGVEPALGWETFSGLHLSLYRDLGVTMVVTLGALLADVPHTRPVKVTGSAVDPELAGRLNLATSRYEGPTGMVGVLNEKLRSEGVSAASLWANVPHYITTSQNPAATGALLVRLQEMAGITLDLDELSDAGERFQVEVDTALSGNPELQHYVEGLEAAADNPDSEDIPPGPLPKGDELVLDVEEFLRRLRPDDS